MVKYIFRSILVLLVLSQYSCNTKEIIEDKSYISYFNYLDTVQVPYDISGLLTEIKADSLILKYDLKTQSNILLKGKLKDFFLNEYIKSTNNFDKFFNGEYSNEWKWVISFFEVL